MPDHETFGPSRQMHRVVMRHRLRGWGRKIYRVRKPAPWRRVKWLWVPKHVQREGPFKTRASNRHWLRQLDRMIIEIRPVHRRRPAR